MKILFGIQGTGNGHISRARAMASHFTRRDIDVQYVFSGREPDKYFDMEVFGDYQLYRGLTFYSENGKVSYTKTALKNNVFQLLRDVRKLNLDAYDLVINDFEPVTAWAGKLSGKYTLGISHQKAFQYTVPRAGENPIANLTMKVFAPTTEAIGLHWDSFNAPILPPIIDSSLKPLPDENGDRPKIVVYLPFENQQFVQSILRDIPGYRFYIYSPDMADTDLGSLQLRKTSHDGFKRDLASAQGVICNSGFELISECLHLGLRVLTKPMAAQMEQQSNAAALQQLGLATTANTLTRELVRDWLDNGRGKPALRYPDVAGALVDWIIEGRRQSVDQLCQQLWNEVYKNSARPAN